MTDNEIIKALECCDGFQCDECPLYEYSDDPVICERKCKQGSLDLINRQKAEIERLEIKIEGVQEANAILREHIRKAVKEFAERIKARKYQSSEWSHGEHPFVVEESDIDDVLEEMVGDAK